MMVDYDDDCDILARTIFGEARGEGGVGMAAVASVVLNRVAKGGWWGGTIREACLKAGQFLCWNACDPNRPIILSVTAANPVFHRALLIAERAVQGAFWDKTRGATRYHRDALTPPWAKGKIPCLRIGHYLFYNNVD
ncbi:MAG: cell wall hydrolase [Alphaproteobacteria bacterium]|nr:cell wall hydrolase [Alphaproteobacteria bacterium]